VRTMNDSFECLPARRKREVAVDRRGILNATPTPVPVGTFSPATASLWAA
jgi:hypothetical protein